MAERQRRQSQPSTSIILSPFFSRDRTGLISGRTEGRRLGEEVAEGRIQEGRKKAKDRGRGRWVTSNRVLRWVICFPRGQLCLDSPSLNKR